VSCVVEDGDEDESDELPPYSDDDHMALLRRKGDRDRGDTSGTTWSPASTGQTRQSKTTSRSYFDSEGNVITEVGQLFDQF